MSKTEMTTEVTEAEVRLHDTWVKGEITTRTNTGADLSGAYTDNNLSVSIFHQYDSGISLDIERSIWIHLAGVYNETQYISTDLLREKVTLAELKIIHEAIGKFISAMDLGLLGRD